MCTSVGGGSVRVCVLVLVEVVCMCASVGGSV